MSLISRLENMDDLTPFCLIAKDGVVKLMQGALHRFEALADIPRHTAAANHYASISMIPFSQMKERGFQVVDHNEPILTLVPEIQETLSTSDFLQNKFSSTPLKLIKELRYNMDDTEFAQTVDNVIQNEIRNGSGCNFLISRCAIGLLDHVTLNDILGVFGRLLQNEFGAYLTYLFFDGKTYFIGASPEGHLSIDKSIARMRPICGTLSKALPDMAQGIRDFVVDEKEINELFMVVDETLKMMMPLCPTGGDVIGPYLREMRSVIHTENLLEGRTDWDMMDAFRATMFAPTMVGSPMESAARVIKRAEKGQSRSYYSSTILMLGTDGDGDEHLDSAITIRSAQIGTDGTLRVQVGASIVRDSDPEKETEEVKAKIAGTLKALTADGHDSPLLPTFYTQEIEDAMLKRNARLSSFWIENQSLAAMPKFLKGKSICLINNEDDFVHMAAHLLQHMGAATHVIDIRQFGGLASLRNIDLLILGPGPGDPREETDPKIRKIQRLAAELLNQSTLPFYGICLGHQILSHVLSLQLEKLPMPLQGIQKRVSLFGVESDLAFYNTFAARTPAAERQDLEIASDEDGFIHALRGKHFGSIQGHPESVLSKDGYQILYRELSRLLAA